MNKVLISKLEERKNCITKSVNLNQKYLKQINSSKESNWNKRISSIKRLNCRCNVMNYKCKFRWEASSCKLPSKIRKTYSKSIPQQFNSWLESNKSIDQILSFWMKKLKRMQLRKSKTRIRFKILLTILKWRIWNSVSNSTSTNLFSKT